jgi:beta-glucosidase
VTVRAALGLLLLAACGADDPAPIAFPPAFRFGAATSATQIEDQNPASDWYVYTQRRADGGMGRGADFIGDAVRGYTKALDDVALLQALHVNAYRFGIEWARVEPRRGQIDEAALAHYDALLDALRAAGIRPLVTIHHSGVPIWVDDPRDPDCAAGPSDTNLCGLGHPVGGPMVIDAFERYARLLAERFGDRVDDWGTVNEPIDYLLSGYGFGQDPPGKSLLSRSLASFTAVLRDYLSAHVRMYRAIKAADTRDADGDGIAASVGLSLGLTDWVAARANKPSSAAADLAARDRAIYLFDHLFVDSILGGTFDADLDGSAEEPHPDWKGALDWLGVQYYERLGVTGLAIAPGFDFMPCDTVDFGACVPPLNPQACVPMMGYEVYVPGLFDQLRALSARWPGLPLVVTESGLATAVGERRAQHIVRTLEQVDRARASGVDVRGYYHWSLVDNFEWLSGFAPRFGLYQVDRATYARTPTVAVDAYAEIARTHGVSTALRKRWGGSGPMAPEIGRAPAAGGLCEKQ